MNSHLNTRFLLIALAVLILAACVYLLFSALNGDGARGGMDGNSPPLTVEEKAKVLHSLTQTSAQTGVAPSEAEARLRVLENISQSSSDSPAAKQSDAEKAKILESLQSQ